MHIFYVKISLDLFKLIIFTSALIYSEDFIMRCYFLLFLLLAGCSSKRTRNDFQLVAPTNSFEDNGAPITICWVNPELGGKQRVAYLERATTLQFNYRTNVGFKFKDKCDSQPSDRQIQITFIKYDEPGTTKCGDIKNFAGCSTLGHHQGKSKITLSLQSEKEPRKEVNLRASEIRTMIHEVMHSLGFPHEHERTDAQIDDICAAGYPKMLKNKLKAGFLTVFDEHSILNYCTNTLLTLSALDIDGLNAIYSKKMKEADRKLDVPDLFIDHCTSHKQTLVSVPKTLNYVYYSSKDSCRDIYINMLTSPRLNLNLPNDSDLLKVFAESKIINNLQITGFPLVHTKFDLSSYKNLEQFDFNTSGQLDMDRLPDPSHLKVLNAFVDNPGKGFYSWLARTKNLKTASLSLRNASASLTLPNPKALKYLTYTSSELDIDVSMFSFIGLERLAIIFEDDFQGLASVARGYRAPVSTRLAKLSLKGITKLNQLKELFLLGIETTVPSEFSRLDKLESFSLFNGKITHYHNLFLAKNIQRLRFSDKGIVTLSGIDNLTKLNVLSIQDTSVSGLGPLRRLAPMQRLSIDLPTVKASETAGIKTQWLSIKATNKFDLFSYADLFSNAKKMSISGDIDFIDIHLLSKLTGKSCTSNSFVIDCA